jgi:hypothetical protein
MKRLLACALLTTLEVGVYHYKVILKPEVILPDFEVKMSGRP